MGFWCGVALVLTFGSAAAVYAVRAEGRHLVEQSRGDQRFDR